MHQTSEAGAPRGQVGARGGHAMFRLERARRCGSDWIPRSVCVCTSLCDFQKLLSSPEWKIPEQICNLGSEKAASVVCLIVKTMTRWPISSR
jgi:hypothetical protein